MSQAHQILWHAWERDWGGYTSVAPTRDAAIKEAQQALHGATFKSSKIWMGWLHHGHHGEVNKHQLHHWLNKVIASLESNGYLRSNHEAPGRKWTSGDIEVARSRSGIIGIVVMTRPRRSLRRMLKEVL